MGALDYFTWRSQAAANMPAIDDGDLVADGDEPPDHRLHHVCHTSPPIVHAPNFHRSSILPKIDQKESLLTKALLTSPESETFKPEIHVATDMTRRRSTTSNASLASTADLTSDGGLTSPARTNTPSPPLPNNTIYSSFAPFSLGPKTINPPAPSIVNVESIDPVTAKQIDAVTTLSTVPAEAQPKKRCITFACGPRKPTALPTPKPVEPTVTNTEAPKRTCRIKFACGGPKLSETTKMEESTNQVPKPPLSPKPTEKRQSSRSPSMTRKARLAPPNSSHSQRDSTSSVRRTSCSPVAVRTMKPRYIIADEKNLQSSDATRFHEFASEEVQEDDWIRKDISGDLPTRKLTINDTLEKENAIRQLGNEAEEEAMEDEDDEEQDDGNDSDDENEDNEDETVDGSEDDASDGNETDNEAGFADSDDESDASGDFQFWRLGRNISAKQSGVVNTYRASAHRTALASSIDSLDHMSPVMNANAFRRRKGSRRINIRPGTPDLPDSTDFVCGTLDEDRPLEDAYISCMEARKLHRLIPQDIDPTFPTSDLEEEDEEEHDVIETANDSEEHVWLHGEFEDSDHDQRQGRRRSTVASPKRLHSPPPRRFHSPPPANKHRLRSPPPRKLFGGHSPKRMRSPPPARTIRSPPASPTAQAATGAIAFAQLGSRAGVTHTKSLPRTPNAFCRQYRASRLAAANGDGGEDTSNGHVRGAIDIYKGLEQKRQRRREKFHQKQCNRARKGQPERKPQPGIGADRMRELGLLMAGKGGRNPYMMSY